MQKEKVEQSQMGTPRNNIVISSLNSLFENKEKAKIICDWDEVIQVNEPTAYYNLSKTKKLKKFYHKSSWWIEDDGIEFNEWFENFWSNPPIIYSDYGSHSVYSDKEYLKKYLKDNEIDIDNKSIETEINNFKNDFYFYQKTPFLRIAEQLLSLVKEDKVEVIFLSAYDKNFFPEEHGDLRKREIFSETFGKYKNCSLNLIGFKSNEKMKTKDEWIRERFPDFNVVIDDNPNILNRIAKNNKEKILISPFYSAFANDHNSSVIMIKNSISNLKKEDF